MRLLEYIGLWNIWKEEAINMLLTDVNCCSLLLMIWLVSGVGIESPILNRCISSSQVDTDICFGTEEKKGVFLPSRQLILKRLIRLYIYILDLFLRKTHELQPFYWHWIHLRRMDTLLVLCLGRKEGNHVVNQVSRRMLGGVRCFQFHDEVLRYL